MILETLLLLGVVAAFLVYGRIAIDVLARKQGKTSVEAIGFADILLGSVLVGILSYMGYVAFHTDTSSTPPKLSWEILLVSSTFIGTLVVAILVSLAMRGTNYFQMTKLIGVPVGRVFISAVFLFLFAIPLVLGAQVLLGRVTGQEEQFLIQALRNTPDWINRGALVVSAVIIAPLCEEMIYRGYLYPLFKRYCGIGFSILATSVLFAVTHGHAPTLAPLFILAVCLTLAYEISGSLLVSVLMHSIFNGCMLLGVFFQLGNPT